MKEGYRMAENEKQEQVQKTAPAKAAKAAKADKKSDKKAKPGLFARVGKTERKKVQ